MENSDRNYSLKIIKYMNGDDILKLTIEHLSKRFGSNCAVNDTSTVSLSDVASKRYADNRERGLIL